MSGYLYLDLKDGKELIKSRNFPKEFASCSGGKVALIGVGGNVGDIKREFNRLLVKLKRDAFVKVLNTSIIYKNPPFGYLEQAYFFNTLILIETKLQAMELLKYLQRVEKYFGRKRLFKDAPRTLDLDIIFYEKQQIKKTPKLIIPHPHWSKRDSVLLPLKFLKGAKCLAKVL